MGICIIIMALSASLNSFMIGKFYGKRGRVPLIVFQIVFDVSIYIFCLFWKPTANTSWMVYVLFAALGVFSSTTGTIATSKKCLYFFQS